MKRLSILVVLVLGLIGTTSQAQDEIKLTLAAYTTPREAYAEIFLSSNTIGWNKQDKR